MVLQHSSRCLPIGWRCYNMSCRRRAGCQTRHNSGPKEGLMAQISGGIVRYLIQ